MRKSKRILSILLTAGLLISSNLFAESFFSGYAGGKLNYSANQEAKEYDPELKLQAFFAGQFNLSQNVWSHLEFSVDTKDFLNESIFHETDSLFQIDELSITLRSPLYYNDNYLSAYMGTYDPIGSDIFLQRYFSIKPIASKITESYLGLAGSILYPHFGVGISDVIRNTSAPLAFGTYLYVNHEDAKYYVFNADIRSAGAFRYFTFDFATGLGIPLSNKYNGQDVIIAIDKLYWHAGTTLLFGNSYTTSLFIQGGIYNASFYAGSKDTIISLNDLYLLFEPRFYIDGSHLNFSLFYLPKNTVEKLLFVQDSLGADINIYSDTALIGNKLFTIGSHLAFSIIDKNIKALSTPDTLLDKGYNINIIPYLSTQFLSGEIHLQANVNIMSFAREEIAKGISVDLGYRCSF